MANYTVTITGSGSSYGARVIIGSTTYTSAATVTVAGGTTITARNEYDEIVLNGLLVKASGSYSYVVNSDVTINLATNLYIVEPVPPVSSGGGQKTLVGGTAYEIGEGKVLIGGTAYAIDHGKTLVNGTAYELALYKSPITVTISGRGSEFYTNAIVNHVAYYGGKNGTTTTTLEIPNGTSITASGRSLTSSDSGKITITLNGTTVASGKYTDLIDYTFTPDCTTVNIVLKFGGTASNSTITITTS